MPVVMFLMKLALGACLDILMSEVPWSILFSHSWSMGSRLQAVVGHSRFDFDPLPRMESSVLE